MALRDGTAARARGFWPRLAGSCSRAIGEGYIFALDARTGKPLWKFQAGGTVIAPPISYEMNGKQYIAVAAGSSMVAFTPVR